MDSAAHSKSSSHHGDGFVGVIYGDVGTTSFRCSVVEAVERHEFVQVAHETCGEVLGRVDEIERKTDLSLDRAQLLGDGDPVDVEERVSAQVSVIGFRDDRGLLQVPRTPFRAGEPVYKAETSTIQEVIGLEEDKKHGAYVGLLAGHNVPVYLDINAMVQKHVSILAKTGGGKSYVAGVLIEELMKHHVTCVILDPHGEYASLKEKGKHGEGSGRFHVEPRAYADIIQVFSPDTKINPGSRPLKFTLSNLDARDILSLTGSAKVRTHLTALRKALDLLRQATKDYTIRDIIRVLEREEDPQNASLIDELEYLSEVEIFAKEGTRIEELVIKCKTQIILKVTNPNDLKAIIASVEGLTTAMAEEISRLPIGVAIMTGGGLQMPLMVEVRPRETRHGGESVKVIED